MTADRADRADRARRVAGIIGGIGPESTLDYYRQIIDRYRARAGNGRYPHVLINSIDAETVVPLVLAGELPRLAEILSAEVERLASAGATFALLAANTPHIVFDDLKARSRIPLLSIVEATADAARARGLTRPALLGTRPTMQGRFFPEVFRKASLDLVVPRPDEQEVVHEIYMVELFRGVFRPESRERICNVMDRLAAEERADSVILGGTELPLLMREVEHRTPPFLDTTKIHVERIVDELLS
ncbi:MAG: aspartate/glutamate racemase family protein [Candidatus Eiseniibacteriota bacterium]